MRARGLVIAALLITLATTTPASAVEYRLEVASLWESALYAYAKTAELYDGASGAGLDQLMVSLDEGSVPSGVMLGDRTLRWAGESVARAYGTVKVLAEIKPGGVAQPRWDDVRWEGQPGERSVWVVSPSGRSRAQSLYRMVLQGDGPARQFLPYVPTGGYKSATVKYSLPFLWFHEERGGLWERYLSGTLDLHEGLGAVVGENSNPTFPDQVYLIVQQGARPATYRAVLFWRDAYGIEGPNAPRHHRSHH